MTSGDSSTPAVPSSHERGASAVEFALIASLLFIVLFGVIQFGLAYNRYQGLQAAAREGARIAAVGGSESEVRDRVRQSQSLFDGGDVQVRVDYSTDDGASYQGPAICDDASGGNQCNSSAAPNPCGIAGLGSLIRVTATVPSGLDRYAITIPLWGSASITYSSQGVFRCENTG